MEELESGARLSDRSAAARSEDAAACGAAKPASGASGAQGAPGVTRRTLCLGLGGVAVALGVGALGLVPGEPGVRPPGGQDESRLMSLCIRCQRCYEACPRQVIVPMHLEQSIVGMRTPELDFSADYCDFCKQENGGSPLCVQACPTQALALPANVPAESTVLGTAEVNESWCLAYNAVTCRFCYDACPYGAIELIGDEKSLRPVVIPEKCNGCGACEAACQSMSAGSISTGADARAITVKPVRG